MAAPIPISILDLSPIIAGSTAGDAFRRSLDLARHAECWGYHRFWLAEHHNMPGIASAATAVVIGHVAAGTSTIRVGAGGIMLPNHSPLVIAEQFGTLASLFPGRIDLGLGRAPGTDQLTAHALRRDQMNAADRFPQDVAELLSYFRPIQPGQKIRAVPGAGLEVPLWILGSSLFGAELAASLGLPFAFASHFAPDNLMEALHLYRAHFMPSETLKKPYAMVAVNAFAADTIAEANLLSTSLQQQFLNLRRGIPGELQPPVENLAAQMSPHEAAGIAHALQYSVIGTPENIRNGLDKIEKSANADELLITAQIYNHAARLRTFEIVAKARNISPSE